MEIEKNLNREKLKEIVTIANSATFLYRSFIQNQSVVEFAFSFTDQELIKRFYEKINEQKTLDNSTVIYAIIVALSLQTSAYSDGFFKNLQNDNSIKWNKEMSDIYYNKVSFNSFERKPELNYSIIEESNVEENDTIIFNL